MQHLIRYLRGGGGGAATFRVRRPGIGAEILLPNTGAVAVTSGAINVFGAWTALTAAGVANDTFLSMLCVNRDSLVGLATCLVEFSYGAGNTPLDAVRWDFEGSDPTADDSGDHGMVSPAHLAKIPAGQQLFARARDSKVANTVYQVYACGFETAEPAWTALAHDLPAGAGRYYPTNTTTISTIAGVFPAFGAYVDVINPAPNDLLVTLVVPTATAIAQQIATGTAYQLAIGPAGNEVVVALAVTGKGNNPCELLCPVWVKSGEVLRVRSASTGASNRSMLVKVYDL